MDPVRERVVRGNQGFRIPASERPRADHFRLEIAASIICSPHTQPPLRSSYRRHQHFDWRIEFCAKGANGQLKTNAVPMVRLRSRHTRSTAAPSCCDGRPTPSARADLNIAKPNSRDFTPSPMLLSPDHLGPCLKISRDNTENGRTARRKLIACRFFDCPYDDQ